jgi:Rrf2 family protein
VLSRTGGYALQATLHIAAHAAPDQAVPAAAVATALDLPGNYLAKILNTLARNGVLVSERGRTGGFRLGREADEITVLDVVRPFDDKTPSRRCLLRDQPCSEVGFCPAHAGWQEASASVVRFFEERSLADLVVPPGMEPREAERA